MPTYRITIRHGRPQQYSVEDVQVATLADAMRHAAELIAVAGAPDADLAEIRVHADPDARRYTEP